MAAFAIGFAVSVLVAAIVLPFVVLAQARRVAEREDDDDETFIGGRP